MEDGRCKGRLRPGIFGRRLDLSRARCGKCGADSAILHAAFHRATVLRCIATGVAIALVCALSAGGVGGVHLRRLADSFEPDSTNAATRSRAGGFYEPLVVTPLIGVRMEPEARILPLDGSALPVRVTVHAQAAAEGTVSLELPAGWRAVPAEASFHLALQATPNQFSFLLLRRHARSGIRDPGRGALGWTFLPHRLAERGYAGLRPYNQYKPAQLKTRKVDVKLAPGLRIGYVMGTGDLVPEAIEGLGVCRICSPLPS